MNVSDDLKQISVQIEPMVVSDLAQVMEIDQAAFPSPWSTRAYEYELRYNEMAHYFVARLDPDTLERAARGSWRQRLQRLWTRQRPAPVSLLVGYVGYWLMAGEAHISTIAVRENYRGRRWANCCWRLRSKTPRAAARTWRRSKCACPICARSSCM